MNGLSVQADLYEVLVGCKHAINQLNKDVEYLKASNADLLKRLEDADDRIDRHTYTFETYNLAELKKRCDRNSQVVTIANWVVRIIGGAAIPAVVVAVMKLL